MGEFKAAVRGHLEGTLRSYNDRRRGAATITLAHVIVFDPDPALRIGP